MEKIGEYLKRLRKDRKLSLRAVEKKVHVSNAYLSQLERGKQGIPTMKVLMKLATAYGVSISDLNEKAAQCMEFPNYSSKVRAIRLNKLDRSKSLSDFNVIPAPDAEFIRRGYESLKDEKKQAIKNYLQYLLSDNKNLK